VTAATWSCRLAVTTENGRRLTRQVLPGVVAVEVILISAVAVLVRLGIGKGHRAAAKAAARNEVRSHRDLRPVPKGQVPAEACPWCRRSTIGCNGSPRRYEARRLLSLTRHINCARRSPDCAWQVEYALQQDDPGSGAARWVRSAR